MRRAASIGISVLVGALGVAQVQGGRAESLGPRELLERELVSRMPKQWQVHVTWREATLLAFITPYPYQEAFSLWYKPEELRANMLALCPAPDDQIWKQMKPEQRIAVEPTVGGKGSDSLRLTCPRHGKPGA